MKVIFLAGGEGKRMAPILKDKCLLKFCGKELILHQLDLMKEVGLTDIVIVASSNNVEQLKSCCADAVFPDMSIQFAVQKEPKGMADAVLSAEALITGSDVLILNSNDVLEPISYKVMLDAIKGGDADAYLLGRKVTKYVPGGYLVVEDGDRVKGIVEKPGADNMPSNLFNLVFHYFRKADVFLDFLKSAKTDNDDQYEVAMDNMMKANYDFRVISTDFWFAVRYPWQIHHAMEYFIKKSVEKHGPRTSNKAVISDKANIVGDVIIEDGVRVFEGATIRGPCYLGKNVIVGNGSLIWNYTHLGDNSVVGYGSEVKHSYVGEACWFHTNYVGDSIIMDGSSFGSGTVTANFRFDEKDIKVKVGDSRFDTYTNKFGCIIGEGCKTGINVSILPGIKIGANSVVGPHVHLNQDLAPNKFIYLTQAQTVKTNPIEIDQAKKDELMRKLKEGVKAN